MQGAEEFYLDDGTCALYMCPLPPSLPGSLPSCRACSEQCPDALPLNRTSRPAVPEMESAVTEAFDAINPNGELP
jgi:hypothetical protein